MPPADAPRPPLPTAGPPGRFAWVHVFTANLRKVAIEMIRYLPNTISLIVTFYALFLLLFLGIQVIGAPEARGANTEYLIVTLVLWLLAMLAIQGIGWEVANEATRGTLEQLYMSPVPAWRILGARMVGTITVQLGVIALMLLLGMVTAQRWLTFDLLTLAPLFALTLTCMVGVGFAVAGLALVFKQIQSLLQVAQFGFMALVAIPVGIHPALELAPVIRGATMIRDALTAGTPLLDFGGLAWALLAVNAAVYLALGVALYRLAERRAMDRGLLGQY